MSVCSTGFKFISKVVVLSIRMKVLDTSVARSELFFMKFASSVVRIKLTRSLSPDVRFPPISCRWILSRSRPPIMVIPVKLNSRTLTVSEKDSMRISSVRFRSKPVNDGLVVSSV